MCCCLPIFFCGSCSCSHASLAVVSAMPLQLGSGSQQHLACQVCGKPCDTSFPCMGCEALCYCSNKHRQLHLRLMHDGEQCSRMKQQLLRGQTAHDVCKWLQQLHCHSQGLLQYCCPMHPPQDSPATEEQKQQHQPSPHSRKHNHREQHCSVAEQQQHTATMSSSSRNNLNNLQWPCLPSSRDQWEAAWAPLSPEAIPCWEAPAADNLRSGVSMSHAGSTDGHAVCGDNTAEDEVSVDDSTAQSQQQSSLHCWVDYYSSRRVSDSSPAALALHFPLTLWCCLTQLLPQHGWSLPPHGGRIQVIYLGPRSELLLLPAFMELLMLLPEHHIQLHMIGPDVPDELHGRQCTAAAAAAAGQGSLSVSCWSGCFHDLLEDWAHTASAAAGKTTDAPAKLQDPQEHCVDGDTPACLAAGRWAPAQVPQGQAHMVFAANAGLPAFPAWVPTLRQLLKLSRQSIQPGGHTCTARSQTVAASAEAAPPATTSRLASSRTEPAVGGVRDGGSAVCSHDRVPVLFSDYCEEAVVDSQNMVEGLLGHGFDLPCRLNPYRQPVVLCTHGNMLPAYSNGFLFGWL